jgi:signal transduction histidine kinase
VSESALERLRLVSTIADDLPVGVWVARAEDGAFVYANRAFGEIMGMGPEPDVRAGGYAEPYGIFGRDGKLYPEDQMPFVRALRARTSVIVDDIVIHRRDGGRVYIRAFAQPMFAADGTMTHIAIAFTDVSDEVRAIRDRADSIARESEVQLQLENVLAQVPIVVFAFDRDGVVTISQGRGLERMGLRPSQLVGVNLFEFYRERPDFLGHIRRALAGESFSVTAVVGTGCFETTFSPRRDAAGEVIGVIGISADVTERLDMQRRLVEVERLAAMGTVAATVAHEINNPLTYVLANLEVLASRVDRLAPIVGGADSTRALIEDMREGVDRVRRIVRDLKAFSRDDERSEPIDVTTVLERAITLAENEIRHRARLVRDFATVPPVEANEARLAQVLLNLLMNAAQAIPEGEPERHEIRVRVQHDGASNVVVFEVTDTGVGIAPELRARIFEPFFTTKPKGAGTGLGLSICHGIVQRFGGTIEVDSVVGRGSTFRVHLPATAARVTRSTPPAAMTAPVRRGRLLVIDDDERVAAALCFILGAQHDVDIETDPRRALQRLLNGAEFDVVFCDVMMPTLSGIELYRILAEHAPQQAERIAFVTGGAFTDSAREFLANVENAQLEKPFDRAQLDAVLRERLT